MNLFRRIAKPISLIVTAAILALSFQLPMANAAMVSTETVMQSVQAQQDISRIHEALNRDDIKVQLAQLGVDPTQLQARVDALSDDEAQQLAQHIDQMPAGGESIIGALLFIFIVLLITDLLGLTSVFSFTKKGSARR